MIELNRAIQIIKKSIPKGKIQKHIEYKGLYVFMVFTPDPYEGEMDPFYSVDMETGECLDFPYMRKDIFNEFMDAFENATIYEEPPKEPLSQKVKRLLNCKEHKGCNNQTNK